MIPDIFTEDQKGTIITNLSGIPQKIETAITDNTFENVIRNFFDIIALFQSNTPDPGIQKLLEDIRKTDEAINNLIRTMTEHSGVLSGLLYEILKFETRILFTKIEEITLINPNEFGILAKAFKDKYVALDDFFTKLRTRTLREHPELLSSKDAILGEDYKFDLEEIKKVLNHEGGAVPLRRGSSATKQGSAKEKAYYNPRTNDLLVLDKILGIEGDDTSDKGIVSTLPAPSSPPQSKTTSSQQAELASRAQGVLPIPPPPLPKDGSASQKSSLAPEQVKPLTPQILRVSTRPRYEHPTLRDIIDLMYQAYSILNTNFFIMLNSLNAKIMSSLLGSSYFEYINSLFLILPKDENDDLYDFIENLKRIDDFKKNSDKDFVLYTHYIETANQEKLKAETYIIFSYTLLYILRKNPYLAERHKIVETILMKLFKNLKKIFEQYKRNLNKKLISERYYQEFFENKKIFNYIKVRENTGRTNPRFALKVKENTYTKRDNTRQKYFDLFVRYLVHNISEPEDVENLPDQEALKEYYYFSPFDYFFEDRMTNEMIASQLEQSVVGKLVRGENVCILGFGQSGAGKTTVLLHKSVEGVEEQGIVFTIANKLIDAGFTLANCELVEFKAKPDIPDYTSFQNFTNNNYNIQRIPILSQEKINSSPAERKREWVINENGIEGATLSSTVVNAIKDRKTDVTPNNNQSSRSHLMIIIKFKKFSTDTGVNMIILDLAGVENRFKCDLSSDNEITRFWENYKKNSNDDKFRNSAFNKLKINSIKEGCPKDSEELKGDTYTFKVAGDDRRESRDDIKSKLDFFSTQLINFGRELRLDRSTGITAPQILERTRNILKQFNENDDKFALEYADEISGREGIINPSDISNSRELPDQYNWNMTFPYKEGRSIVTYYLTFTVGKTQNSNEPTKEIPSSKAVYVIAGKIEGTSWVYGALMVHQHFNNKPIFFNRRIHNGTVTNTKSIQEMIIKNFNIFRSRIKELFKEKYVNEIKYQEEYDYWKPIYDNYDGYGTKKTCDYRITQNILRQCEIRRKEGNMINKTLFDLNSYLQKQSNSDTQNNLLSVYPTIPYCNEVLLNYNRYLHEEKEESIIGNKIKEELEKQRIALDNMNFFIFTIVDLNSQTPSNNPPAPPYINISTLKFKYYKYKHFSTDENLASLRISLRNVIQRVKESKYYYKGRSISSFDTLNRVMDNGQSINGLNIETIESLIEFIDVMNSTTLIGSLETSFKIKDPFKILCSRFTHEEQEEEYTKVKSYLQKVSNALEQGIDLGFQEIDGANAILDKQLEKNQSRLVDKYLSI